MTKKIKIYSDGGARGNPGPAAIGFLICDEADNRIEDHAETIGDATNNVAEYTAVIRALSLAKELNAEEIDYFVDSELVAKQMTGIYKVKAAHLKNLFREAKEKEKTFKRVSFFHVPREHEKISYADKLLNRALNNAGF